MKVDIFENCEFYDFERWVVQQLRLLAAAFSLVIKGYRLIMFLFK